jgi:hypothetical protein
VGRSRASFPSAGVSHTTDMNVQRSIFRAVRASKPYRSAIVAPLAGVRRRLSARTGCVGTKGLGDEVAMGRTAASWDRPKKASSRGLPVPRFGPFSTRANEYTRLGRRHEVPRKDAASPRAVARLQQLPARQATPPFGEGELVSPQCCANPTAPAHGGSATDR